MTDTCVAWTGAKCNLESYLIYDAEKYKKKKIEAQMRGNENDVTTFYRLQAKADSDARTLLAEAGNVELDHRYPEGFYDAMLEVVEARMKEIESKSYGNKDADMVFLKALKTDMGG